MRHGKKPATHDRRDLQYAHYRDHLSMPAIPPQFGYELFVPHWGMLGNDSFGDCVWAGAAHETMLWNATEARSIQFSDASVLSDYSAVTGFDPDRPDTDEGTNVRAALKYRRSIGVLDAHGARHAIGPYVALEPGNWEHLLEATMLFEAVGIGIQFPGSASDQFDAGKPWSVVPGASIEGGHYVPVVAYRNGMGVCVTWNKLQPFTRSFYQRYCDEAFAMFSLEMLNRSGKSLRGLDLATLEADLAAVAA